MAGNTFNNLQYMHELIEAGVPQAQAEVMAKALVSHTDNLVTRDYLDARFEAFAEKIDARFDTLKVQIDGKFEVSELHQDTKLAALGFRIDSLEERINHKLRYFAFTQAIIVGGVFLPLIKSWIS